MTPRVTVIIATYNRSEVLRYAIRSVLAQTFADFELLVVGDACTDDSEQVVAGFEDPRVRWINLPTNTRHQSGPNNEGLRQARGELIAYLGHDDLWLPHHLEILTAAFDSSHCDVAHGLVVDVGPDGAFLWPVAPRPNDGSFSPPSGMAHRRHVTEEMGGWRDYREVGVPDVELWRRAQRRGYAFTFVPRLTAIKFPASWRRDVYKHRSANKQADWLRRIESEPDFEQRLLVRLVTDDHLAAGLPYRELLRHFLRQTMSRISRRLRWLRIRPPQTIDELRRYKGLE